LERLAIIPPHPPNKSDSYPAEERSFLTSSVMLAHLVVGLVLTAVILARAVSLLPLATSLDKNEAHEPVSS
jgi:hypothetical protein